MPWYAARSRIIPTKDRGQRATKHSLSQADNGFEGAQVYLTTTVCDTCLTFTIVGALFLVGIAHFPNIKLEAGTLHSFTGLKMCMYTRYLGNCGHTIVDYFRTEVCKNMAEAQRIRDEERPDEALEKCNNAKHQEFTVSNGCYQKCNQIIQDNGQIGHPGWPTPQDPRLNERFTNGPDPSSHTWYVDETPLEKEDIFRLINWNPAPGYIGEARRDTHPVGLVSPKMKTDTSSQDKAHKCEANPTNDAGKIAATADFETDTLDTFPKPPPAKLPRRKISPPDMPRSSLRLQNKHQPCLGLTSNNPQTSPATITPPPLPARDPTRITPSPQPAYPSRFSSANTRPLFVDATGDRPRVLDNTVAAGRVQLRDVSPRNADADAERKKGEEIKEQSEFRE